MGEVVLETICPKPGSRKGWDKEACYKRGGTIKIWVSIWKEGDNIKGI